MFKLESIDLGKQFASDSTSEVRLGDFGETKVAVKISSKPTSDSAFISQTSERLKNVNHPGICAYYGGGVARDEKAYLVMECVLGPSLAESKAELLSFVTLESLTEPLVGALQTLHANNLVHGDICAENIRTVDSQPKIVDFSFDTIHQPSDDYLGLGKVLYQLISGTEFSGVVDSEVVVDRVGMNGLEIVNTLLFDQLAPDFSELYQDEVTRPVLTEPEIESNSEEEFQRLFGRAASPAATVDLSSLRDRFIPFLESAYHEYLASKATEEDAEAWVRDAAVLVEALRESEGDSEADSFERAIKDVAEALPEELDAMFVTRQAVDTSYALLAHVRAVVNDALRGAPSVLLGADLLPEKLTDTEAIRFVELKQQFPIDAHAVLTRFGESLGDEFEFPLDIVVTSRPMGGFEARRR